jgi:hypothetical protein
VDVTVVSNTSEGVFSVSSLDKTLMLRAETKEERNAWVAAILAARHAEIKASLGHTTRKGYDEDANKVRERSLLCHTPQIPRFSL